jgi:hypothetical protein
MVRLVISVEGTTEERFVERVLQPHFQPRQVYLTATSLRGHINVDRVGAELKKLCHSFDYLTTFYDFYGFQRKQPGETKQGLEARMLAAMPPTCRERCIPYVQMHEFEGLLFSSPSVIADVLQRQGLKAWAAVIVQACGGNPEAINDRPETAPKHRLQQHSNYRQTTHGPLIAEQIGLPSLRQHCAGFDAWLTQLEELSV